MSYQSPDAGGFDDAQGGFATPAAPGLLSPGMTDPRVRSFTAAILDPNLVAQFGEDAVKQAGISGLVPPPEDLDRVALFAPPPISGDWPGFQWLDITGEPDAKLPDGSYRDPTWADVQKAGTLIGRPDLDGEAVKSCLAWWRQAYALGPLPEDEQGVDDPRSSSWNWPLAHGQTSTDNFIRRIYFWGFGKDGRLYKHMQVQKSDGFGNWHIFNQYGQNLTFVWNGSQWLAGWDFGDWFTQNKVTIVKGLQLAVTAVIMCIPFASAAVGAVAGVLFGVSNFGLSIGVATAIGSAVAAQQAFIAAMTAIAKGDLGEAFKYFSNMVTDLGSVPVNGDAKLFPPEFTAFVQNPAVQGLAKVVEQAKAGDINSIVKKAAELGGSVVKMGTAEIYAARSLVSPELIPWFDRAAREGGAALARRGSVPWYAIGVHDFGTAIGTLADPITVTGVRAPKAIPKPLDYDTMTLAELESQYAQSLANYPKVAATAYGQSHPAFLAKYQDNINQLKVAIDVRKNPNILVQQGGGGATLTFAQALALSKKNATQAPAPVAVTAPASPLPIAVGGGLLALLFFL